MLLRGCIDLISKQLSWKRPFLVGKTQTPWYSTDTSIPSKPKGCRNPWTFFLIEQMPKAQVENPGTSAPKLFQLLSAKWQKLSEESQKKYLKLAEDDKIRYNQEIEAYKASLTPENLLTLAHEKAKVKMQKMQQLQKKKLEALGMPKKPPNAYILFCSDFMRKKVKDEPEGKFNLRNQAANVSAAWSNLPADEKAKWEELAAVKANEYKKKIVEWESEMASKGYLEIVDDSKT